MFCSYQKSLSRTSGSFLDWRFGRAPKTQMSTHVGINHQHGGGGCADCRGGARTGSTAPTLQKATFLPLVRCGCLFATRPSRIFIPTSSARMCLSVLVGVISKLPQNLDGALKPQRFSGHHLCFFRQAPLRRRNSIND